MGYWDEICPISGLNRDEGPKYLFSSDSENTFLKKCILTWASVKTSYEKKFGTLLSGLHNDYEGWKPLVIGTFDEDGYARLTRVDNTTTPPTGYEVTVHHIHTDFDVTRREDYGYIEVEAGRKVVIDNDDDGDVNVFCLRTPYYYLRKLVDRDSLPPRQTAFPQEPVMSFEGELYEIVNTRRKDRLSEMRILYDMDYEDLPPRQVYPFNRDNNFRWVEVKEPFSYSMVAQKSNVPHVGNKRFSRSCRGGIIRDIFGPARL
ncbi:hypothetical protein CPB86DRAFT_823959 [Serendipita vermifera]|nr:hypothetical protein CPB86DRAFT_823959 [Serendipita vermifera]